MVGKTRGSEKVAISLNQSGSRAPIKGGIGDEEHGSHIRSVYGYDGESGEAREFKIEIVNQPGMRTSAEQTDRSPCSAPREGTLPTLRKHYKNRPDPH